MGLSKYLKKPGEKVKLLAFSDDCTGVEILEGFTKDGKLCVDWISKYAIELNDCKPLVHRVKGKIKGVIYPVDVETSQGVRLINKAVNLEKGTVIRQLQINPGLVGNALDSDLLKNALGLKPQIYQIIIAFLVGFLVKWFLVPI